MLEFLLDEWITDDYLKYIFSETLNQINDSFFSQSIILICFNI
jgi:hypothetical protein